MDEHVASAPLPSLLTMGRAPYARAIVKALEHAAFGDVPRGGARVIAGIDHDGPLTGDEALALDTPRAGALIAQLVQLGYAARTMSADGTPAVVLTERGRAAARTIDAAVHGVDTRLAQLATPAEIAATRRTLAMLGQLDSIIAELPET